MYSIHVKNLDRVVEEFKKAPTVVNERLQKGVKEAGKTILSIEKKEAPVATGTLRRTIEFRYRPISAMIFPTSGYAVFIEEGTGLYGPRKSYIMPKRAKVLAFKVNGKMVFAKKTRGQKANPFVQRTRDKAEPKINKIFDDMLKEIIEKI